MARAAREASLPPVHDRHLHVQQDQAGRPLSDEVERGGAVRRSEHRVALVGERRLDRAQNRLIIIDHEDRIGCYAHAAASVGVPPASPPTGRLTTKRVPPSGGNSAAMRPPWSSTISRLMYSPIPIPE